MSYVKRGTVCFISKKGSDNLFSPSADKEYFSFFKEDTDVQIKNWICSDDELSAVLTEAQNIESLVAAPGIETIVWVKKEEILNDN